ncbi:MAG: hypothetical protein ACLGII_15905, partial [Gammaproteobacteria bacterium]
MSGIGIGERAASMIEKQKPRSNRVSQPGRANACPAKWWEEVLMSMWTRGLAFIAAVACCPQLAVADGAQSVATNAGSEVLIELKDYRFI